MISYHFVPISSQKGVLFLRHQVLKHHFEPYISISNSFIFMSPKRSVEKLRCDKIDFNHMDWTSCFGF